MSGARRFLVATFIWFACMRAFAGIPVILSTDVGNEIDDQWAIAYLLTQPAFDTLGILSAHAPSLPDPSAHATYQLLQDEVEHRLGMRTHPPLLEGSSLPLVDLRTPRPNAAVQFLLEQSRAFTAEHRLNLLVIGAATDAASALLTDPTLKDRIRIVAMAFNDLSPGGAHEYNEMNDPRAWQVLLDSGVPLVVGTGDVCRKYLSLDFAAARDLLRDHGPVASWLWNDYELWYFRNVKPLRVNDFSKSWVIWDIITLAYLRGYTTQETVPRPGLDAAMNFVATPNRGTIERITSVDSSRLWADFTAGLDRLQQRQATAPGPSAEPSQP